MSASPRFSVVTGLALAWWLIGIGVDMDTSADAPSGPAPVVITLKAKVNVSGRTVTIGDVADLSGGSDPLRERAAALDLGEFGATDAMTVKSRQIEFRLRLADFPVKLFRIEGAAETAVAAVRQPVTEESVFEAAKKAALQRLPWPATDLAIKLVQPITAPMPAAAAGDEVTLKAEPHAAAVAPGRVQIDVTIFVRGEKKLALPVYLDIRVIQRVALARRGLSRGELLLEENVLTDRRATEPTAKVAAPETLTGRRLKRSVAAGQVIQPADLEDAPVDAAGVLVRNRQAVKMTVRLGAVNVVANGEAQQDGKMGDRVRVQNVDSKKVVVGRVTGAGAVDVD